MTKFLTFLAEKQVFNTQLTLQEMTMHQLSTLYSVVQRVLSTYKINLVTTTHGLFRLVGDNDPARAGIDALNFYETMKNFCAQESNNFTKFKKNRKEYIAVITNTTTKLNIVVSIDYDKKPEINGFNNMKIITAMVKDNFGSDNFSSSIRVAVS